MYYATGLGQFDPGAIASKFQPYAQQFWQGLRVTPELYGAATTAALTSPRAAFAQAPALARSLPEVARASPARFLGLILPAAALGWWLFGRRRGGGAPPMRFGR